MAGYLVASEWILTLPLSIGTITGSSTPLNLTEMQSMLDRISAELDGAAAGQGYQVPVPSSATYARAQMEEYTDQGGGCKVLRRLYSGAGDRHPLAADYCTAYKEALKALREGKIDLIGAPSDPSGEGRELPRSYLTSHQPYEGVGTPVFDLDSVF